MKSVAALVHEAWTAGKNGDEVAARHLGVQAQRIDSRHKERGEKVKALSERLAKRVPPTQVINAPPCLHCGSTLDKDCMACIRKTDLVEVEHG